MHGRRLYKVARCMSAIAVAEVSKQQRWGWNVCVGWGGGMGVLCCILHVSVQWGSSSKCVKSKSNRVTIVPDWLQICFKASHQIRRSNPDQSSRCPRALPLLWIGKRILLFGLVHVHSLLVWLLSEKIVAVQVRPTDRLSK